MNMNELIIQITDFASFIWGEHLYRACIYFITSIILANIADKFFKVILAKFVQRTNTKADDTIIQILHRPIYYTILFIGLSISIELLRLNYIFDYVLLGTFKTVAIIFWGHAILQILMYSLKWYTRKRIKNSIIQTRTIPLFDNLSKIFVFIVAVYFIFLSWNIDLTGWLASASIIGVVLSFAAKDTVANLFAGIFIMADSPYKEGDYINLDTGERGWVRNIGIRSTRILTRDDIEITIPNSVIAASKIINESGGPNESERVRINIMVAYGTDIDELKKILLETALKNNLVSEMPKPRVRLREFGDSGLIFQLLFWIEKPSTRGRVIDEVSSEIYKIFNLKGISIPFPQRTVHINQSKD